MGESENGWINGKMYNRGGRGEYMHMDTELAKGPDAKSNSK